MSNAHSSQGNEAWSTQFARYRDPRALRVLLLGVSSGLPFVLIGSMLTLWLKDTGLSRASIGYAGAIYAAYSINFLWSPLIDRIRRPAMLTLGQRKSWIVLMQLAIALLCVAVSMSNPAESSRVTILLCLAIAIASATQDIAIDAFRIDSIAEHEEQTMSVAASMAIAGWWTGYAGIGAIVLITADSFQLDWGVLYLLTAPLFIVLAAAVVFFPEPDNADRDRLHNERKLGYLHNALQLSNGRKIATMVMMACPFLLAVWLLGGGAGLADTVKASAWYVPGGLLAGTLLFALAIALLGQSALNRQVPIASAAELHNAGPLDKASASLAAAVIDPLLAFFRRNGLQMALALLAFILLFKIGEAFLGRMSLVFYREIGFSNSDIAYYSKLVSWAVTVVFSLLSGAFVARFGVLRGLFIAGLAMSASNLMFAWLAAVGPVKTLFAASVVVDGFTSAWSTVAFVAFLSSLCDRNYTATQYALLASLGTLGRTLFASGSGQLVDWLQGNWALFFILTALAVIPSLLILLWLGNKERQS
ncbi:MAG: MFS transporter [Gammaproteobacteria bacterium]|nr:MFS transporter [Gammaproteobacteria bacterium]NND38029.1 MFS transporter [Pseudomonadales bacterium]NNM10626.1 MFS transporter [Pseudomonadales bacterium]